MCVCVCVRERERRGRGEGEGREAGTVISDNKFVGQKFPLTYQLGVGQYWLTNCNH